MDFNYLWSNYKDLVLIIATAIVTLIFSQIVPWLWKAIVLAPWKWLLISINSRWGKMGFEKEYLSWLIEENRYLKIRGLRMQAIVSPEIESIYVPLRGEASAHVVGSDDFASKKARQSSSSISRILAENKRVVLLGDPGSGKTTLLRYIAVCYARILRNNRSEGDNPKKLKSQLDISWAARLGLGYSNIVDKNYLPLLISLRSVNLGDLDPQRIDLSKVAFGKYLQDKTPKDYLQNRLQKGNCVVLFDGLDEVNPDMRRKLVEWLEDLVATYPENRYIISSRIVGYTVPLSSGFRSFKLEDFNDDDVEKFVRQWYAAVEVSAGRKVTDKKIIEKHTEGLVNDILRTPQVRNLSVNPLLLSIISLVHWNRLKLPEKRVDLYEECTLALLGYWDQGKGIMGSIPPTQKRVILEDIAYNMQLKKVQEISEDGLMELLRLELPRIGADLDQVTDFLTEIKERSGLLIERGARVFAFSHLTFQEFLTARYIFRTNQSEIIMDKIEDDQWQEVLLLYCGLQDASQIVETLLQRPTDLFNTWLLLAGECSSEAIALDERLRAKVIDKILNLSVTSKFESLRESAIDIGKKIAPQQFVSFLEKTFHSNEKPNSEWAGEGLTLLADHLRDDLCAELLSLPSVRKKMLRRLRIKKNISDNLFEVMIRLIDDEEPLIRQMVADVVEKHTHGSGLTKLVSRLAIEQDDDVKTSLISSISEYLTPDVFYSIGMTAYGASTGVQGFAGMSLLYTLDKWMNKHDLTLLLTSLFKIFKRTFNKSSKRKAVFIFWGGIFYLFGLLILWPARIWRIADKGDDLLARTVRKTYWILFGLIGYVSTPFFMLVFPQVEVNFWIRYFRASMALQINDPTMNGFFYQYINNTSNILFLDRIAFGNGYYRYDELFLEKLIRQYFDRIQSDYQYVGAWRCLYHFIQMNPEKASEFILERLSSSSTPAKEAAIVGVVELGNNMGEDHLEQIRKATTDENLIIRTVACWAIGQLRDKKGLEFLMARLSDSENRVQDYAFDAIARIGDTVSVDGLKPYLNSEDDKTRDYAFDTLWRIAKKNKLMISL